MDYTVTVYCVVYLRKNEFSDIIFTVIVVYSVKGLPAFLFFVYLTFGFISYPSICMFFALYSMSTYVFSTVLFDVY